MLRFLPLLATALFAFALGAAWTAHRRQREASADAERGEGNFLVLWWVPVGCALAAALLAVLHFALDG